MNTPTRRDAIRIANDQARAALSQTPKNAKEGHLGDLVWWSLEGNFRERCPAVTACVQKHGLDPRIVLPEPTTYSVAFGRAIDSVRPAIRPLNYTILEAQKGPNGERRVAILKISRGHNVHTSNEGIIACPNDGSRPFVETADSAGITTQVYDKTLDLFDIYTTDDIRQGITTLFHRYAAMACAGTEKKRMAPYFLPPGGSADVERFSAAMAELKAGEISQFAGYSHDARSVNACVSAVNRGLEAELSSFSTQAEKYANSESTRESTLATRLTEASNLRQQADLYRTILGAAVSSIDDKVAMIEDTLRKAIA